MTPALIIAAMRTAVVPRGGGFAGLPIHALGAPVIEQLLAGAGIAADEVDELILSNALGAGGNPARLTALAAGLPERVAGLSIDRQCAGGLDALMLARALIVAGQADVVIAGGVESYSRRPLRSQTFTDGRAPEPYDQPPFAPWPGRDPEMANAADKLAQDMSISREAQDLWAVDSHTKARAAQTRLRSEIVVLADMADDSFTRDLTPGLCARAAVIAGSITTANTSVAADAAGFCLVVSDRIAARLGAPVVELIAGATLGDRPEMPGLAPVAAIERALGLAGLGPRDLTVAEMMEAYAAQAIACIHTSDLDPAIVNLGGGSLARGHPIGASGAINAVRLFHELRARGGVGLAAIAAAGGIGSAAVMRAGRGSR